MRKGILRTLLCASTIALSMVCVNNYNTINVKALDVSTSTFSVKKSADGNWEFVDIKGGAGITKYIGKSTNVKVPTTVTYNGVSRKVLRVCGGAFEKSTKVEYVTIPEGVEAIGDTVFNKTTIKGVVIPSSVVGMSSKVLPVNKVYAPAGSFADYAYTVEGKHINTSTKNVAGISVVGANKNSKGQYVLYTNQAVTVNVSSKFSANATYNYYVMDVKGNKYRFGGENTTSTSCKLTVKVPDLATNGRKIVVDVKDSVGTYTLTAPILTYKPVKLATINVTGEEGKSNVVDGVLTVTKGSKVKIDTTLDKDITAKNIKYKYTVSANGTTADITNGQSSKSSIYWNTVYTGTKTVKVTATDEYGKTSYLTKKVIVVDDATKPEIKSVSSTLVSGYKAKDGVGTQTNPYVYEIGAKLKLSTTANSSQSLTYAYNVSYNNASGVTIRNYSNTSTAEWTPEKVGSYKVTALVKSTNGVVSSKDIYIKTVAKTTIVTDKVANPNFIALGDTLTLNTTITGNTGIRSMEYNVVTNVGDSVYKKTLTKNEPLTWKPTKAGSYIVNVSCTTSDGIYKTTSADIVVLDITATAKFNKVLPSDIEGQEPQAREENLIGDKFKLSNIKVNVSQFANNRVTYRIRVADKTGKSYTKRDYSTSLADLDLVFTTAGYKGIYLDVKVENTIGKGSIVKSFKLAEVTIVDMATAIENRLIADIKENYGKEYAHSAYIDRFMPERLEEAEKVNYYDENSNYIYMSTTYSDKKNSLQKKVFDYATSVGDGVSFAEVDLAFSPSERNNFNELYNYIWNYVSNEKNGELPMFMKDGFKGINVGVAKLYKYGEYGATTNSNTKPVTGYTIVITYCNHTNK